MRHEISIVSAIVLKKVIKEPLKFIFVDKEGQFFLIPSGDMKSDFFSDGGYKKAPHLKLCRKGFVHHKWIGQEVIALDGVISLIHGRQGEDGTISSLLEFYHIPFIAPRKEACVVSYNKIMTKWYAKSVDMPTLPFEVVRGDEKPQLHNLNFPLIIKPSKGGSSLGINVAHNEEELSYYIDEAREYDDEILLEPFIDGVKEYNIAGFWGDEFHFSIIEEPQKEKILDFDKKYLDFGREEIVPKADISPQLEQKIQRGF